MHLVLPLFAAVMFVLMVGPAVTHARGPFTTGIQSDNLTLSRKQEEREIFTRLLPPLAPQIVRTTVGWNEIARNCRGQQPVDLRDPANPCYDWHVIDETVQVSRAAGADVVGSISRVPEWVNNDDDYRQTGAKWPQFQRTLVHYEAFCHAVAGRFANGPFAVRYWTVWNEPNSANFFLPFDGSQYERYARLTVRCAKALKQGAPGVFVAAGPTGPSSYPVRPITFIRKVQPWLDRLGGRRVLDAWAHNPYTGAAVSPRVRVFKPPRVGIGNISDLFRVLDENPSTRGLPVWATEFSQEAGPSGVSLADQATWLAEAQDVLWRTGRVNMFVWYVMLDPLDPADFQSGLYRANGAPKPAAEMFRRPISRHPVIGYGQQNPLWGRSNVSPATAQLVYTHNGRTWSVVPNQIRMGDGTVVANLRLRTRAWVAVRDEFDRGPSRKVTIVQRTVAAPSRPVRAGTTVTIRGKSFRSPRTVRLLISYDRRSWRRISGQRRSSSGVVIARFALRRNTYVAVADRNGRSAPKRVRMRR